MLVGFGLQRVVLTRFRESSALLGSVIVVGGAQANAGKDRNRSIAAMNAIVWG